MLLNMRFGSVAGPLTVAGASVTISATRLYAVLSRGLIYGIFYIKAGTLTVGALCGAISAVTFISGVTRGVVT